MPDMTEIIVYVKSPTGIWWTDEMSADLDECIEQQIMEHFKLEYGKNLKDFKWVAKEEILLKKNADLPFTKK